MSIRMAASACQVLQVRVGPRGARMEGEGALVRRVPMVVGASPPARRERGSAESVVMACSGSGCGGVPMELASDTLKLAAREAPDKPIRGGVLHPKAPARMSSPIAAISGA